MLCKPICCDICETVKNANLNGKSSKWGTFSNEPIRIEYSDDVIELMNINEIRM